MRIFLALVLGLACSCAFAQNSLNISVDDATTGWTTFLDPAGVGTATATAQTFGNVTPSLDGGSMLLSISGPASTNVGFYKYAGIHNTLTYTTLDMKFYVPSLTKVQALEFDQFQYVLAGHGVVSNTRYYPGTECVTTGNHWDIWDSLAAHWVNTGVPCSVSAAAWHHLVISTHRVANDTSCSGYPVMHYDSIVLDGATVISNRTTCAGPLPLTWTEQSGYMIQMDTNSSCGAACTITENVDEQNFSLSTGPVFPSGLLGDDAYCSGGTANFTNDGPAQGIQNCNYTPRSTSPSSGSTWAVNNASDFTTALAGAACGDNIVLTAGITIQGNFTAPAKACDATHWITIQTSGVASFPAEGVRATPCYWGVGSLPDVPFGCASTTKYGVTLQSSGRGNTHALTFAAGGKYYRLIGLEFMPDPAGVFGDTPVRGVVDMTRGGLNHIVLDQVWGHGLAATEVEYFATLSTPGNTSPTTNISVIDSFFTDFHCVSGTGQCTDNYVFNYGVSNAADGTFKFVNNYMEAAGENIFSGGAAATTVPCDVEVRLNYFRKRQIWNPSSPTYNGGVSGQPFVAKNLLENKNVCRELIEGNYFENSWGGFSQFGQAIDLTPKNYNGTCPNCAVTNVIVRYNGGTNVAATYQIANTYSNATQYSFAGNSYSIHDNLWDDILDPLTCGGNSPAACIANLTTMTQLEGTEPGNTVSTNVLNNMFLNHETMVMSAAPIGQPSASFFIDGPNGALQSNLVVTNSILTAGTFGILSVYSGVGTHCGYGQNMAGVSHWLGLCWAGWSLTNNAIVGGTHGGWVWPDNGGVLFPANYSAIGFVNYHSGAGGDYRLCSAVATPALSCLGASFYHNAASDGLDLGANLTTLNPLIAFAIGPAVTPPPPPAGLGSGINYGTSINFGTVIQ